MPPSRLLVVSSVVHFRHAGQWWAYGPYARELDIWADLFPCVEIAAPCREAVPPPDYVPFSRGNIGLRPQPETGGDNWWDKVWQVVQLPRLVWSLSRAIFEADAVHVRCPSNLGLLGVVLAPLFKRLRVAKYAGQWGGSEPLRLVNRLQRALLRSHWWGSPVTVYGQWPGEPAHVHPFFTSMMTVEQVRQAAQIAKQRSDFCSRNRCESEGDVRGTPNRDETAGFARTQESGTIIPLRVLYCGRLTRSKRIDELLGAVPLLTRRGISVRVAVLGDGPDRDRLAGIVADRELKDRVEFVGGLPFEEVMRWYAWAHCLVLPSTSEGWPKVLAEAMCHGVVCLAVGCGHVPRMLDGRGVVLEEGTAEEIAAALESVARRPESYFQAAAAAASWAQQFTLEGLRQALGDLLSREWAVSIGPQASPVELAAATERPSLTVLKSV